VPHKFCCNNARYVILDKRVHNCNPTHKVVAIHLFPARSLSESLLFKLIGLRIVTLTILAANRRIRLCKCSFKMGLSLRALQRDRLRLNECRALDNLWPILWMVSCPVTEIAVRLTFQESCAVNSDQIKKVLLVNAAFWATAIACPYLVRILPTSTGEPPKFFEFIVPARS